MSTATIECVPNFSEGRDPATIAALVEAVAQTTGAILLDVHSDAHHNRTVLTMAGGAEAVSEAAFRTAAVAVDRIDLTHHTGEHPRMGAVDVVPFVRLSHATRETCVALARGTAARIARELRVPTMLYGDAAATDARRRLRYLRQGGFEGLRSAIGQPGRGPDFGPTAVHPTAGATAVGARGFLVAFNVYLDAPDREPARRIARSVRESSGGLASVQAMGVLVDGQAQVSMNLTDIDQVTPRVAFEAVRREARAIGMATDGSEIVGLVPARALPREDWDVLQLRTPARERILEIRLEAEGLG